MCANRSVIAARTVGQWWIFTLTVRRIADPHTVTLIGQAALHRRASIARAIAADSAAAHNAMSAAGFSLANRRVADTVHLVAEIVRAVVAIIQPRREAAGGARSGAVAHFDAVAD
jgi:hypothetical protein